MREHQNRPFVALIVGVTGMAGLSIAQALKSPTAPGGPWKVYGSARRPMPTWFPSSTVDHFISFDAVNFDDTHAILSPLSSEITHVFWVAIQVRRHEEDNVAVNATMLSNVLNALTAQKPTKLCHVTVQTGTKHYMGPIHDEAHSARLAHPDPPFLEDAARLPGPNFYYALEDLIESYGQDLTYSIHRSSIIIGASSRSVYNALLTLAVYAEICKRRNVAFRYPGSRYTWEHFCDMTDARVLAEQHVFAALSGSVQKEAFNCTNGDVFTWKRMWGVLCEEFGVEFVPLDHEGGDHHGFDLTEEMRDKGEVWDQIVEEKGLIKTKMEEITWFDALQGVLKLKFQHVCSMNKSKEFGFFGYADSMKSVKFWVAKLREMNIIP